MSAGWRERCVALRASDGKADPSPAEKTRVRDDGCGLLGLVIAKFRNESAPGSLRVEVMREIGRALLVSGGVAVVAGAFLFFGGRLPLRLGRLPGDVVHRGEHTTLYFPIVTCLVLSVGLSLIFWLFSHFRR